MRMSSLLSIGLFWDQVVHQFVTAQVSAEYDQSLLSIAFEAKLTGGEWRFLPSLLCFLRLKGY